MGPHDPQKTISTDLFYVESTVGGFIYNGMSGNLFNKSLKQVGKGAFVNDFFDGIFPNSSFDSLQLLTITNITEDILPFWMLANLEVEKLNVRKAMHLLLS